MNGDRYTEEMKLWLFDLAHGLLDDDQTVKGYLKHYALHGFVIANIFDDILHHTTYGIEGIKTAKTQVFQSIEKFVV